MRISTSSIASSWTCPLWMDVSVTGLVIYPLLYQIFPQKQMPASVGR